MPLLPSKPHRERLLIIYLCFFVSGVAGLIYEILWNKYLALFIGSTGRAHVMTLAVFMGGLALGAAVIGRRADSIRNPLKLYILLELGIGILGLAYPFLFEPYRAGFIALAKQFGLHAGSSGLMAAKLVFCALTILIPTFLMGGTLPVLGRYIVSNLADLGPRIATLYYVNTFGAFVGCLLAGFLMISTYGLRVSMMMAAGLNFCVCILACLLFQEKYRMIPAAEEMAHSDEAPSIEPEATPEPPLYSTRVRKVVFWTVGLSGFVAMVYEIAWIRLLALVLGSSTYSFSLMVAAFIFGIGLGSFLLSFKRSEKGYDTIYGVAELGLGLSVLAMLPLIERVPYWFNHLATLFQRAPFAFGPYMFSQMLVCFMLMLVPTVLLGLTLPAASRVVTESVGRIGKRVGSVYAVNTIGTLLGAAAAGLIFLPTVGLKMTFELGVVLNLACGLAVIWVLPGERMRSWKPIFAAGAAILFVGYYIGVPNWDKNILSSGVYRQKGRFQSYQSMLDMLAERDRLVAYRDGVDASIAVVDSGDTRTLLINGKADASDTGDMTTQMMISHYPLIVRPNSKDVLVIGMGSGVSAGSALQHPIDHLDVVEISEDVVDFATEYFGKANLHFADDPRTEIHIEDAKTFLLLTQREYDVIVSEPTNPWIAGVAGLFSQEFFNTCRDHLKPDGLFVQWIHVYEIQDEALQSVLRTFTDTFPYFVLWNMNRFDIAIMGSPSPFELDYKAMEKAMARKLVADDLTRLGVEHPLALLMFQMFGNTSEPTGIFKAAPINSDFRPYLEYKAPVGFFAGSPAQGIKSLDMRAWPKRNQRLWIDDYEPTTPPTAAQFAAADAGRRKSGSLYADQIADWADRWVAAYPDDPIAVKSRIEARPKLTQWQCEQVRKAARRFPESPEIMDLYAHVMVRRVGEDRPDRDEWFDEAHEAVARARDLHPKHTWRYALLDMHAYYHEGRMLEVLQEGAKVFPHLAGIRASEGAEATYEILIIICEAAIERNKYPVAQQCLKEMALLGQNDLRFQRLRDAVARIAPAAEGAQ